MSITPNALRPRALTVEGGGALEFLAKYNGGTATARVMILEKVWCHPTHLCNDFGMSPLSWDSLRSDTVLLNLTFLFLYLLISGQIQLTH